MLTVEDLLGKSKSQKHDPALVKKNLTSMGVDPDVVEWLLGDLKQTPAVIDKMMDGAAKKINITMAMILLKRIASLGKMFEFLDRVEDDLLSESELASEMSVKFERYKHFSKLTNDIMEFTRKFIAQNEHTFAHDQPADELAILLRTLDPELLRKLVGILRSKGASLTERDIKTLVDDDSPEAIVGALVE